MTYRHSEETFDSVWTFVGADGKNYTVLHDTLADVYKLHISEEVDEVSYTNYAVREPYTHLTGNFFDNDNYFYIIAKDNLIHCDTKPAAFIPCGLKGFTPKEEIKNYVIYGKIMSQYSWLTWVKETEAWPKAMANLLGSKNSK